MKKLLLMVVFLIIAYAGFSQTIFTENFQSAWTLPTTLSPAWSGTTTPANNVWHMNSYTTGWSSASGVYSPTGANGTTQSARFHTYDASSATTGDLISPTMDLSAYTAGTVALTFYHINTSGTDVLNVYSSNDNGSTWSTALAPSPIGVSAAWTLKTVMLPGNSATTKIKFTATSDYGTTDIGIDEVKVFVPITANAAPINFTATAVNVAGMTIGWTDNSTNETAFRVYRSTDGITYAQVGTDIPSTSTATTGTTYSQVQTGLAATTTYYYKIAAVTDLESGYLTGSQATSAPVPMTGVWTIDPAGSGPNNFTTFADAIGSLNGNGVGTGGVTFNVADGAIFNEVPQTITATGTAANPIVFQRTGTSTMPVINFTGTSGTSDAGFKLMGSDYITFDGLKVNDAGTTSSNYLDYGFYYYANSATDGCQNNTVKNCLIDLSKANTSSRGVSLYNYASVASGTNSNNKFYNVTVQDAYYGYYLYGSSTVFDDGNEINTQGGGTSLINNLGGSSYTCYGIYIGYQTNLVIANTTISNLTASSSSLYAIYESTGTTNTASYYNNEISTISNTGSYSLYGLYVSTGTTHNIYGNKIHGLSAAYNVYGMSVAAGTTNNVYKNTIYDINYSGASSYIAYGLSVSSGTTNNVYNNYIYDIRGAAGTTGAPTVRALSLSGGTTDNVFYNTVYLNYTSTAATNQSAALYVTTGPTTADLRNNIFVNASVMTTGTRAVAFYKSSTSLTNLSANTNNNLYYAGTASSKNLLFYDGTNSDQTLATYKTRVTPRDAAAVTENPPFISAVSPYNLHMGTGTATQTESGGITIATPLAILNDFDGDARYPNAGYPNNPSFPASAPDIGADEFAGTPQDLNPPTITYTPIANTLSTGAQTLAVTITDASGVGVSPNDPVLYWNANAGAYAFVHATSIIGNVYTYTFGGGSTGDVIHYYVVAQDNSPAVNIGSFPAGATLTKTPPRSSAAPASPSTYKIMACISGTKTVGASGADYPTLTAAAAALNGAILCGPLTFNLLDANYSTSETFPIVINANPGSSAVNTVTIKPNTTSLITGSGNPAVIILNGCDYVTIDGSNAGGTDKSLTISNTYTAAVDGVVGLWNNGVKGATNCTFKNCILKGGSNTSTYTYGIFLNASGGLYNNTTIQNNTILNCYYGMQFGGVAGGLSTGGLITGNTIGSVTASESVGYMGMLLSYADGVTVANNLIQDLIVGNTPFGIYVSTGVVNSTLNANNITGIKYTGSGGYGARGIYANTSSATSNLLISNNMISMIGGDGWSSFSGASPVGIYLDGTMGGLNIYYNSVYMSGNLAYNTTSVTTAILFNTNTLTNIDLRDNIFMNSMNNPSNTGAKNYAIYSTAPKTSFSAIDYNDYYVSGTQGVLGYLGADQTTLAAWQVATGADVKSVSGDPKFTTTTDLHIITTAISPVSNAGTPLAAVLYDFDGNTRAVSPNLPDIGADEYTYAPPLVLDPTAFTATVISATSIKLDFSLNGNGNNVAIAWNTTGVFTAPSGAPGAPGSAFAGGTLLSYGTTSPVYQTSSPLTHYYYKAYSYDLLSYSSGITAEAITPCGIVTDFSENFDGVTPPALPNCWVKVGTAGSAYTQASSAASSPNCLYIYGYSGSKPVVAMPFISNAGTGTYQLRFKLRGNYTAGEAIEVGYLTDRANDASFVSVTSVVASSLTYVEYTVTLGTAPGANTTIAFRHPALLGYSCLIDDVVWEPIPPCPKPTNLTAAPGSVYADLGWTAGGSESGWDIEWSAGSTFVQGTGTTITGVTNPYRLTGLASLTTYSYYVRGNCDANGYSVWTGPKSFTTLDACPPPTSLNAKNITTTSASLRWVEQGTATAWNVEYGVTGYTHLGAGATVLNSCTEPYTLGSASSTPPSSPLSSGTSYTYYVQSACGSTWAGPYTFNTVCETITGFPWNEGFESDAVGSLPPCWAKTTGSSWMVTNNASSTYDADAHTGTQFLRVNWTAGTSNVWTPAFHLIAGTQYDFTFWWAGDNYSGWDGSVYYNTLQNPTGATVMGLPFVTNTDVTTKTYAQVLRQFTPATTGDYNFSIQVTSTGGPWYLSFDDFNVQPTPPCPSPTDLTATGITTTTANLGWNANGSASWQIEWNVGATFTQGTGTMITTGVTNPYTLGSITPLTPTTTYSYYVRGFCTSSGFWSPWTGPFAFTTTCETVANLCEDFPTATLPNCWSYQLAGSYTANHWSMQNTTYAGGTAYEARAYWSPEDGAVEADQDRMVSPGINVTGVTNLIVSFNQMLNDYDAGVNDVWVKVQYSTDGTTWTDAWSYAGGMGASIPAENKSIIIPVTGSPTTMWVAWTLAGYSFDINDWYVDNICIAPAKNHDIATTSVDMSQYYGIGSTVTPKSTIKNNGVNDEVNIPVTMTIGTYVSTVTVPSLLSGASAQVSFDPWTPAAGTYTAHTCTGLVTDEVPTNDCMDKSISVEVLTKFYCYEAYDPSSKVPQGPAYFYKEHPGSITSLAATTSTQFISAGSWINGTWYGSEYYDSTIPNGGGWWTIDPTTGLMTQIAALGRSFDGITYDHTANILYGIDAGVLYTIVPATGIATLVGTPSTGTYGLVTLATDGSGYLYSVGMASSTTEAHLFKIDPNAVGGPTAIDLGSTGLILWYAQDMGYDYVSNTMYAPAYQYSGVSGLYTVDLTSGAFTLVGLQNSNELDGLAIPYSSSKTLNLSSIFLEGFYTGLSTMMQATQRFPDGSFGPYWADGSADHISVELHTPGDYATVIYTAPDVPLSTTGTATVSIPSTYSGSYYLTIKQRNHLETVSALPLSFAGATITYAFDAFTKAYDGNMTQMLEADGETMSPPLIFGGDVNQDAQIESDDINAVGNDAAAYVLGFTATDIVPDAQVESADINIVGNNAALYVFAHLPM